MKATLEPTPELFQAPINGVRVPCRVWRGTTEGGVPIEAYVLSIVPDPPIPDLMAELSDQLKAELPPFMVPSRQLLDIDLDDEAAG